MAETVDVTRTVVCPLQSSQRKREYLQTPIEEYQSVCEQMADLMVSVEPFKWSAQNSTVSRLVRKHTDPPHLYAHDRNDAAYKVAEAFGSRVSNRHDGEYPSFGDGNYIRMCSCCGREELVENDSGFGLFVNVDKYRDGEWFHVVGGEYQYEVLRRVTDGDGSLGNVELHVEDDTVTAHITVTWPVETHSTEMVPRVMGVDVGKNTLYACAVCERDGTVTDVELRSGDEQRHHRNRLLETQRRRQRSSKLERARDVSDRERYTEQVMHNCSREIVDLAAEYAPICIVIEDLTNYRQTAGNPIHDWPFRSLQEKIAYKAQGTGVPVESVDPKHTSTTCRKCGETTLTTRDGSDFSCGACGYQVHADVNAAMNIASRGIEKIS